MSINTNTNTNTNLAQQLTQQNVSLQNVSLHNVRTLNSNTCYSVIYNFMKKKRDRSENTYKSYVRYYNEFFNFMCGKDVLSVDWDDILNVTYSHVEKYQMYMRNDKGFSANTCNQKLFALKSLWDNLNRHNNDINLSVFNFEELDAEDNSYASLTREEVDSLIRFAEDKYKGDIQSLMFEFLFVVGCRKNVLFTLTKDMVVRNHDFSVGKDVWVVKYKDKGKVVEKAISDDFHAKIISCYESGVDKVFNVSHKTFERTFESFRNHYGLYEKNGKKVTIHSIKKTSGWSVYKMTNDINATKEHMQHKNIETTSRIYLDGKDNYCSQGSYMLGNDITADEFSNMSKEELLRVLDMCGKDVLNRFKFEVEKEKEKTYNN